MVYLTRQEHFNAAHKLFNPKWSREQNEAVFGVCANENWHGHNYDLYVTIKGQPDADTGFLFDVKDLSKLIRKHVIDKLDHKNLNTDVEWFRDLIPTSENVALVCWRELRAALPESLTLRLRLWETPRNYVDYQGA